MIKTTNLSAALTIIAAATMMLTACIRKEPLNAECDIVNAFLPDDELNRSAIIENNRVTLIVKNYVNISQLAPTFEITPGATISPASGTTRDFTVPQTYIVTSQDGEWSKSYTVEVQFNTQINLSYSFENIVTVKTSAGGSYDEFIDVSFNDLTGKNDTTRWASGNAGYALTNGTAGPASYPTYQSENGFHGKCVEMVTRSTGKFGAMVKKPIAAGNLFIGKFDMNQALAHPLLATQFGTPFYRVPRSIKGVYRYTPGETYEEMTENGTLQPVAGKVDECNLYAVFFESTADMEWLNGENVLAEDNPNIVAVAQFSEEQRKATEGWKSFEIPFDYRPGKNLDPAKLQNGDYNITIVMSSSIDGDFFSGAVGSTMLVDEIEITCN